MPDLILFEPTVTPDVINVGGSVSLASKTAVIWWDAPVVRSSIYYDGSYWTADGLDSFIAPLVNDADLGGPAFTWLDGAGTSRLVFHDPAASHEFRELRWTVINTSVVIEPTIEHSPDGVVWTPIVLTSSDSYVEEQNADYTTYVYRWASVGSPAYWQAKRAAGTDATIVTEAMFREYGAAYDRVKEIRIYDVADGVRSLYATVVPPNQPSASTPLAVTGVMTLASTDTTDTCSIAVVVVVVGDNGRESYGVSITVTDNVTVASRYVTNVAGIAGAVTSAQAAAAVLAGPSATAPLGARAIIGSAPATRLSVALTAVATSIVVESNVIASGDRLLLQKATVAGTQTEYLAVTSGATGTGPYTYSVTRNLDGSGANAWDLGDGVLNLGQAGKSFIEIYSAAGLKGEVGPAIVGNERLSATFDDWSPRWVVGNLNGKFGYVTDIFGAAFGVPTAAWVKVDPINGLRFGHNATTKFSIDASGNASYAGSLTVGSGNDIARMDPADATYRLWIGHATAASAPFRVTKAGAVTASSGVVGGFTLGPTSMSASGLIFNAVGVIEAGDYRLSASGIQFFSGGVLKADVLASVILGAGFMYLRGGSDYLQAGGGSCGSSSDFFTDGVFICQGDFVVGPRGAAVANVASPNATDLASAITLTNEIKAQFNTLLSRIRPATGTHGLIAD